MPTPNQHAKVEERHRDRAFAIVQKFKVRQSSFIDMENGIAETYADLEAATRRDTIERCCAAVRQKLDDSKTKELPNSGIMWREGVSYGLEEAIDAIRKAMGEEVGR